MTNMSIQNLLTVTDVARLSGRARASVHRDIRAGKLKPAETVPGYRGAFLITRDDAERYADAHKGSAA